MRTVSQPDLKLQSLDDAVRLLREFRHDLAPGSLSVWRIIDHACKHIERQIKAALTDQSIHETTPPSEYARLAMSEPITIDRQPSG